ncbi:hypothetical protein JOL62DRAFT_1842 [Phyllosticta paracitricarpa]|uniref:Uncharacterized protein n=1 Tax=Phyllosticta paracitricarpa TaxID=2016321 RepID=A0ABR1NLD4_9PEZI
MVLMVEPDENEAQYSSYPAGYQQSSSYRDRRNHSIYPTRSDSSIGATHATTGSVSGRKAPSPVSSRYPPQRAAPNPIETLSALRHGDTKLDQSTPGNYSQPPSPPPGFRASRATPLYINTSHGGASKNTNYGPASTHNSSSAARAIFDHHHGGQQYHDSHNATGVRRSRSLTTQAITMGTAITTNSPVPAPSYHSPPAGYSPKPPPPIIDDIAASAAPPSRSGTPAFTLTDQLSPKGRSGYTPTPTLPSSKACSRQPSRAGLREEENGTGGDNAEEASGSVTPLAGGGAGTPANTPRRAGYDVDDDDGRAGRSVTAPSRTGSVSTSSTSLHAGRLTPVTAGTSSLSGRTPSTGRSLVRGATEIDRERKRERERELKWESQQQQQEVERYQRQQQQQQGRESPMAIPSTQRPRAGSSAHTPSPAANSNNTTGVVPKKVEWVEGLNRQASIGSISVGGGGRNSPAHANSSPVTPTTALPLPPPPPPPLAREKSKRGGLSSLLTSSKSSLKCATSSKEKAKDKERDRGLQNTARERKGGTGTRTPTPTLGGASANVPAERGGSANGSRSGNGRETPLTALPVPPLPPPMAPPRESSPRLEVRLSGLGELEIDDGEGLLGL